MNAAHPILTCAEAKEFEATLFAGNEVAEWAAMQQAGRAVADAILKDFEEICGFPNEGTVLVLAGKGHNAGDAMIAAQRIVERYPLTCVEVVFLLGERTLRPLAQRAWRDLQPTAAKRTAAKMRSYDVVIDGVFGFQFRAPLDESVAKVLHDVNELPVRLRAAVDLPSGLDEADAFRADFTYATGIVKTPLLTLPNAGRLRYLDLGFFQIGGKSVCNLISDKLDRVLTSEVLDPLRGLRASRSDKRTYGHLFIVGGSRGYPGAVLMSVLAALHSGAGLVTAFVPESLVAAFAARAPEAMWVGWPETPEGGLALEGSHLLRARIARATALLIGPGLGREAETMALVKDIVGQSSVPLVIDADALQPDIVAAGTAPRILTPHAGEFARIERAITKEAITIKKDPVTCIHSGTTRYHGFFGGPVLARGGSGDILAGLTGGLLAQAPADLTGAAARAVVWHGMAADHLARTHGQVAVTITQLIDFLPAVLRS
ncbi:NAD(P)H-hydrate dehydratase [Rariglobus hedericola]|uniref:ADP-dependent (S)-NAD(P)H-hydrate dehydratase n=1 Tax=Rariglobus hedericola TaxID=2597822 RepID=A0A556QKW7_9BACT|nr:NAD(P)H-hydrate dehydratase [Rariglobus hedericola]TSJ77278.1 NAD(P)H-hydrate dehydratase [Rariglobus hedericola]